MMMFDAEAESKKQEIFDLLLVAGYFRIRIPSLSDFDKILGGISWGILCSGFDIDLDLEYSDEFRIKEKIKLAERIVKGLKNMSCPHPLQPHQIQGLDYGAIHPVIKWLLQFVLETRQLRQDENEAVSSEIGTKLVSAAGSYFKSPDAPVSKPTTKNKKVRKFGYKDPIRVYSALAEFGNRKAASVYQKMIIERKQLEEGKAPKEEKTDKKPATAKDLAEELRSSPAKGLKKPEPATGGKRKKSEEEEEEKEVEIAELEGFEARPRLQRRNSIDATGFMELLEENKEENEKLAEKIKEIEEKAEGGAISALQQETAMFNEQKEDMHETIERLKARIEQFESVKAEYEEDEAKTSKQLQQVRSVNADLVSALKKISKTVDDRQAKMKSIDIKELDSLIARQMDFKERRNEIKKQAKEEKLKIEAEIERLENKLAEINAHEDVQEITALYEDRRQIYLAKEAELAEISKETALLMRKIQEYPNNIEISQYSKRYVDLVDIIAKESENQKKLDLMNNRKVDVERMSGDHLSLLKSLKVELQEVKKDKQRLSLAENIAEIHKATEQNLERSKAAYKKTATENEACLTDLDKQLTYQRDYYQLLQKVQLEFDK